MKRKKRRDLFQKRGDGTLVMTREDMTGICVQAKALSKLCYLKIIKQQWLAYK